MNIVGLSTNVASVDLKGQVGMAVLNKSMDTAETLGTGMVDMLKTSIMEQSVNPAVGGNVDVRI